MSFLRRARIPALSCALAVLLCEIVSRANVEMGISDDWSYISVARHLADTGHIAYNGWVNPIVGWQLYLGAAFIKLFGFSFTVARMHTLLVAMLTAFMIQRTLVRARISERNATIGTLALVISPLFLMLSVTYMTDIPGLFAIILCLYGCLRALQAGSTQATITWLCFAVACNAVCGTSRQIAWLGLLVIVPSTLWLLRARRSVLIAGAAATLAGVVFIVACMMWFRQQPYSIPEGLFPVGFPLSTVIEQFTHTFLDLPFLLLPIFVLFIPSIRSSRPRTLAILSVASLGYIALITRSHHQNPNLWLEPTQGDWVNPYGTFALPPWRGQPPLFLHRGVQIVLTILTFGGLFGAAVSFAHPNHPPPPEIASPGVSWKQLGVLLIPFTVAYTLLLIPRATVWLIDRYLLALLVITLLCLLRFYQERIQLRLPNAAFLVIGLYAIYAIATTHNFFAFYRANLALASELHQAGIPDTAFDPNWEYDGWTELQHSSFVNDPRIVVPAHAYVPIPTRTGGPCEANERFPHVRPLYGLAFDPNACQGPAPFAPVTYSRWLSTPVTLYLVKYPPSSSAP